jgi:hypothetical protein
MGFLFLQFYFDGARASTVSQSCLRLFWLLYIVTMHFDLRNKIILNYLQQFILFNHFFNSVFDVRRFSLLGKNITVEFRYKMPPFIYFVVIEAS